LHLPYLLLLFLSSHREKLLSKVDAPAAQRAVQSLRGKANAVAAENAKFVKATAAIDFDFYKKRLKYSGDAVSKLESAYKGKVIPQYTATLPAFEAKKRAAMLGVVKSTVEATKQDLEALHTQLEAFEQGRITEDSSMGEVVQRFPGIAREIEEEIREHKWAKDSL
jgi:hypothetical protein